ncbi:MAG: sensor histidine kinase [Bacteroidetes bacterium]|nr:sensor histidine kinase [Bacteroidota bacterium]
MTTLTLLAIILLSASIILWILAQVFILKRIKNISEHIKSQIKSKARSQKSKTSLIELEQLVNEWSDERKEEIEQLEKLENYRKEFLGNVSHELKTPIFNIQGYISTLLDGGLEDKTINRDYLKRADKSVNRIIAIVEDLQTITQLEKGELEIDEERFDIVSLAKDVIDAEELKAKEKKISFELANDSSQQIYVLADKFRIRQVIANLIVNSVRYGKENGKSSIKISDAGEKIIVDIADSGIGIPKEHLHRVFERFYRVDKSRSREQGGTGLGLSIVKHILEAHGQNISVMSTEGAGSVFSFTLKKE